MQLVEALEPFRQCECWSRVSVATMSRKSEDKAAVEDMEWNSQWRNWDKKSMPAAALTSYSVGRMISMNRSRRHVRTEMIV